MKSLTPNTTKQNNSTYQTEGLVVTNDTQKTFMDVKRELQRLHDRINLMGGLQGNESVVVGGTTYTFINGILRSKV